MPSYIAIDLKSFYASVECTERGFDPLLTNLVVADESRTEKTICLAVSPSLKSYGIPGRVRLFEVIEKVKQVNEERLLHAPKHRFTGDSFYDDEVKADPSLALNYYIAPPRMGLYMQYSSKIYDIYLKYVSKEDIHVYSIDEVFLDVTNYLNTYKMTERELAMTIVKDVLRQTGITATCGIGTNLYLCKVAMDIVAKKIPADEDGVRIAELDEMTYRKLLWDHQPLTDFWRIGRRITEKLIVNGMFTQGDIARMSLADEDRLYSLFGINAELLIDHAWGYEPCRMEDIKRYKPIAKSISSGQVLKEPYPFDKAKLIIKEMAEGLVLDLLSKQVLCDQIVLTVGYDVANTASYTGEIKEDFYGRKVPKSAHGSENLEDHTSSRELIMKAVLKLFDRIVDPRLTVRRMYVVANHILPEENYRPEPMEQLDLFTDVEAADQLRKEKEEFLRKERKMQEAILHIKERYGKNAIMKGNSLQEGATAIERNDQVGGHRK